MKTTNEPLNNTIVVTLEISEEDYNEMIEHFASKRFGRPLVGVIAVKSQHVKTGKTCNANPTAA